MKEIDNEKQPSYYVRITYQELLPDNTVNTKNVTLQIETANTVLPNNFFVELGGLIDKYENGHNGHYQY